MVGPNILLLFLSFVFVSCKSASIIYYLIDFVTASFTTSIKSCLLMFVTIFEAIIGWLTEDAEELEGTGKSIRHHLLQQCKAPPHHLQIQALRLLQVSCHISCLSTISLCCVYFFILKVSCKSEAYAHKFTSLSGLRNRFHHLLSAPRETKAHPL